jgi:hypothetical protein
MASADDMFSFPSQVRDKRAPEPEHYGPYSTLCGKRDPSVRVD